MKEHNNQSIKNNSPIKETAQKTKAVNGYATISRRLHKGVGYVTANSSKVCRFQEKEL